MLVIRQTYNAIYLLSGCSLFQWLYILELERSGKYAILYLRYIYANTYL